MHPIWRWPCTTVYRQSVSFMYRLPSKCKLYAYKISFRVGRTFGQDHITSHVHHITSHSELAWTIAQHTLLCTCSVVCHTKIICAVHVLHLMLARTIAKYTLLYTCSVSYHGDSHTCTVNTWLWPTSSTYNVMPILAGFLACPSYVTTAFGACMSSCMCMHMNSELKA